MQFLPLIPPRTYDAGFEHKTTISDCGHVELLPDEQLTFTTPDGGEYDLTRKNWGFYATPSTNGRLASFGLRTLLTRNRQNRCFVLLVEQGKEELLHAYLQQEQMDIICWLDDDAKVHTLTEALHAARP